MIPLKYRLPLGPEFKLRGKRLHNQYFTMIRVASKLPHSRLGIIISKKTVKTAVQRNTIRRRISFLFLDLSTPLAQDFLIIITRNPLQNWQSVRSDLIKTLQ